MEDDAHVLHFETGRQLRTQRVDVVDVHIEQLSRLGVDGVMVFVDVRIETYSTTIAVHELDLAHLGEFIERLVDGSQRDARHPLAGNFVKTLGGGVRLVAVHEGKQQLSLRGQATALLAVFGGDEFGGLHDVQTIRS